MLFRTGLAFLFWFMGMCVGHSQDSIYEIKGANADDLYPYMLFWKDAGNLQSDIDDAAWQLEQGNFQRFDTEIDKNLGLFPEPVWFYLRVKNTSDTYKKYWWTFYTHADSIIVYSKQNNRWLAKDTLDRNKRLYERTVKHRALTADVMLDCEEEQSFLVKIVNPRHTQNSFVSLTTPEDHLLWEKQFYWKTGGFISIFLAICVISFAIGLVTRERAFLMFSLYMLIVVALSFFNELLTPIIENNFLFSLVNRTHPLILSLIATCLNFYIVDYIFGNTGNHPTAPRVLGLLNSICLVTGGLFFLIYLLFMHQIHSGQPMYLIAWYGTLGLVFISLLATAVKIILLARKHHNLLLGIAFLLSVLIVNPATYHLNYSGILSIYEITYPNYFYWFALAEFIFIISLIGWRYKKNLKFKHKLELEFAQRELLVLNEERQQIASDLHDDLGATLNTINLLVTHSYPGDKRLIETITAANNDIRIFYEKLSGKATNALLQSSIERLIKIHNSYKKVQFGSIFTGDENKLSEHQKEHIYKISSEIFTNALKHSNATEVIVQLLIDKQVAQLIIEDNGIGFSVDKIEKAKGMGIRSIKKRVAMMNGTLHLSSDKGNTTFIINIPIKK